MSIDFFTTAPRRRKNTDLTELERAKGGELLSWWGDVVITFKGRAPSLLRALSENGHEDFYKYCLSHDHFFSFIDMSGRLLIVNRKAVERLILLDEADDQRAEDLLDLRFDAPPVHRLAEFYSKVASGFHTDAKTDRALQLVAELYEDEALTRADLLAAERGEGSAQLAAAVEQVGVVRLTSVMEHIERSDDPFMTAQSLGGSLVDVHLISGVSRTVSLGEEQLGNLATAGDMLEDEASYGEVGYLWAGDGGVTEIISWSDIAWVEATALVVWQAFERMM